MSPSNYRTVPEAVAEFTVAEPAEASKHRSMVIKLVVTELVVTELADVSKCSRTVSEAVIEPAEIFSNGA